MSAAATQAEAAGDWPRAAELLAHLQATCPEASQGLRLAHCYLRAEQWQQAAACYAQADLSTASAADRYQAGFALAKLGDLTACLRHWQQLACTQPEFLAQQEQVGSLLIEELHARLDELPQAEEEVLSLLLEFSLDTVPGGAALLARCRRLRLARLWQEERFDEIVALAATTDWLQPTELAIQAKAACQLLATTERTVPQLQHFMDAWLSLLFHPQVGPQTEAERQALLDFGLDLLGKQAARQPDSGEQVLRQWQETLALLQRVAGLTSELVYAPALAVQAGIAGQLLRLIQNSRDHFASNDEWAATGAAYSAAAPALLLTRAGKYEAALAYLQDNPGDTFTAWGAAQVRTACGLHALQQGHCREAEHILTDGPVQWSVELEQQLLARLDEDEEQESGQLTACLGILALLPEVALTKAAFCAALTNQVVRLRSSGELSPQRLATIMKKALALHPGDEFAQMIFAQVSLELELAAIEEAFDRDCFAEAACLAAASHFPRVTESFLVTVQQTAARIERGDYPDRAAAVFRLEELLASVSKVDASHSAARRVRRVLDSLRLEAA
jgi:hypothetical protein